MVLLIVQNNLGKVAEINNICKSSLRYKTDNMVHTIVWRYGFMFM